MKNILFKLDFCFNFEKKQKTHFLVENIPKIFNFAGRKSFVLLQNNSEFHKKMT